MKKTSISIYKIVVAILACVSVVSGYYFFTNFNQTEEAIDNGNPFDTTTALEYNGQTYDEKSNLELVLFMGIDEFGAQVSSESYNNSAQTDFVSLIIFDHTNKTFEVLYLSRDTILEMDVLGISGTITGTYTGQLALAHTYGDGLEESCENTVTAVSRLLNDISIDYYISVTMSAIPILNDAYGGIEVTINEDLTSVDSTLIEGETILLDGDQALNYLRARMTVGDGTNAARMERQQIYLDNLYTKMMETDVSLVNLVINDLSDYLLTDATINELTSMNTNIQEYEFLGSNYIEGETVLGEEYYEVYLDEDSLLETIFNLFYNPNY